MNKKILIIGLIILGLIASLYLVVKVQETRKGATFAGNTLYFQPGENINKNVGEEIPLGVFLAAGTRKVDFTQTKICYGSNLSLSEGNVALSSQFTNILSATISGNCLNLIVKAEKTADQLPAGEAIQIATLKFKAETPGTSKIEFVQGESYASGPSEDVSQMKINIDAVRNLDYVINTSVQSSTDSYDMFYDLGHTDFSVLRPGSFVDNIIKIKSFNRKVDFAQITFCYTDLLKPDLDHIQLSYQFTNLLSVEKFANNCAKIIVKSEKPEADLPIGDILVATIRSEVIKNGVGTLSIDNANTYVTGPNQDTSKIKLVLRSSGGTQFGIGGNVSPPVTPSATCVFTYSDWSVCSSNGTQTRAVNTKLPLGCQGGTQEELSRVCTYVPATTDPMLNFKMTYSGLQPDANCADDWKVDVTVLNNSVTKTYTNIVPVRDETVTDKRIFKITMRLVGFPYKENVAVFVKGPQHLQMKYGRDSQEGNYGKAGGELSLADDATWFNFSGYPLLAGDATGDTEGVPDGIIDGRDWSYVKTRSLADPRIAGRNVQGDLDGNCQINTFDPGLVKLSLTKKFAELY